ncbi:acyltransferase [Polaribacter aestuariivivens]|nr:DapH/DapD/GlmU-related protein [Polaribacter aestuariivivens]
MDRIPHIILYQNAKITLGENVVITSCSSTNPIGVKHKCILAVLNSGAQINIGNNTGITGASICCSTQVDIGSNVYIGSGVGIWDTDFHPINWKEREKRPNDGKSLPIKIGDNVFIGANSIILKGVTIDDGAVIGAGSVVSRNVGSNEIVAGNPAKKIKKIIYE